MVKKSYLDRNKDYPNSSFYSSWASTLILYLFIILYCNQQSSESLDIRKNRLSILQWGIMLNRDHNYEYNKIWALLLIALAICLILFFDVEIALLFPWVLSLYSTNWFSFYIMIIFLFLLTIGFFYEWHRGALVWPHQQYSTVFTDYKEI